MSCLNHTQGDHLADTGSNRSDMADSDEGPRAGGSFGSLQIPREGSESKDSKDRTILTALPHFEPRDVESTRPVEPAAEASDQDVMAGIELVSLVPDNAFPELDQERSTPDRESQVDQFFDRIARLGKWQCVVGPPQAYIFERSAAECYFYCSAGCAIWKAISHSAQLRLLQNWISQSNDPFNSAAIQADMLAALGHFKYVWGEMTPLDREDEFFPNRFARDTKKLVFDTLFNHAQGDSAGMLSFETLIRIGGLLQDPSAPSEYKAEVMYVLLLIFNRCANPTLQCRCIFRILEPLRPYPSSPSPSWTQYLTEIDASLSQFGFELNPPVVVQSDGVPGDAAPSDPQPIPRSAEGPRGLIEDMSPTNVGNSAETAIDLTHTDLPMSGAHLPTATTSVAALQATHSALGLTTNSNLYSFFAEGVAASRRGKVTQFKVTDDDDVTAVKLDAKRHVDRFYTAIQSSPTYIRAGKTEAQIKTNSAMDNGFATYATHIKTKMTDFGVNVEERHHRIAWRIFEATVNLHESRTHNFEADELCIFMFGAKDGQGNKRIGKELSLKLRDRLSAVEDSLRDYKLIVKDCSLSQRSKELLVFRPETAGLLKSNPAGSTRRGKRL